MKRYFAGIIFLLSIFQVCAQETKPVEFVIETPFGQIEGFLYDDTPLHRDNFMKLIKEGWYEESDINKIIPGLYIQGGSNKEGKSDPEYTIPNEVKPEHIHKKGALSAAWPNSRFNYEGVSSGSQFFIVQGVDITEEFLNKIELQRAESEDYKQNLAMRLFHQSTDPQLKQKLEKAIKDRKKTDMLELVKPFEEEAKRLIEEEQIYKFSDLQRSVYLSEGGAPELDGSYTVFGEITKGMDVVDKISKVKIISPDKPKDSIKITITIKEPKEE
ncbi:MAG: peptidylprolyl isomerase [Bacteroidales bacterium]|jgi:peptidyl-prolyl cis-trans isomerase B (cyclophilin B)|nr:peptidylprolyl isomerase [Bacteroidales bacterium]